MNNKFNIGFSSLKDEKHYFDFKIDNSFFEQFETSEITSGSLEVSLELDKKPNLMNAEFQIKGEVEIMCDRCTDNYFQPIISNNSIVYKFGDEELMDENVITVFSNEFEINVAHAIYEFIITSLPPKRIHLNNECNEEMLKDMDKYMLYKEEE